MESRALVLFSGGQDSTTCLAWALERYDHVETVGFDYGQRHSIELTCRPDILGELKYQYPQWANKLGEDHLIDLGVLGEISKTALTSETLIEMQANGLPNTFVPGRNLLFFTLAGCIASRRNLKILVGGMCETDFSGYPDCRDDTIKALQVCLNLGMNQRLNIETPLMWINKAQTWKLSETLGGVTLIDLIIEKTHTCYLGNRTTRSPWGYGCGQCPACELRANGYNEYLKLNTA